MVYVECKRKKNQKFFNLHLVEQWNAAKSPFEKKN